MKVGKYPRKKSWWLVVSEYFSKAKQKEKKITVLLGFHQYFVFQWRKCV